MLVLLAALVLAVFWQSAGFELIRLDDSKYTLSNPAVRGGLSWSNVKGAFSTVKIGNFMPVTQLSYMSDAEIFGLKPSGFHITNVLIHLLNSVLFFLFLYRATGSPYKSFFAAALWAVHPLRAESVAWVAERSDLLSGLFFFLALFPYSRYAEKKEPAGYLLALSLFFLGIASKPTLAVFPLILLIFDFWPLERVQRQGEAVKNLLVEKIPFLALSVLFSVITLGNQSVSVSNMEERGLPELLSTVVSSCAHYLRATFLPVDLVMQYGRPAGYLSGVWAALAWLALAAAGFLAWRYRKKAPAEVAGWCWYLAALLPVSGIVPLGFYYVADHFTYLPHAGLMIALVWGACSVYGKFTKEMRPPGVAGAAALIVLSVLCFRQVSVWRDGYAFFGYIDRATAGRSALAKNGLAVNDLFAGRFREAYDNLGKVIELDPSFRYANGYKGIAAEKLGRFREAAGLYKKQLQQFPGEMDYSVKLANVLIMAGDLPGAARQGLENTGRWPNEKVAWDAVNLLGGEARARALALNP